MARRQLIRAALVGLDAFTSVTAIGGGLALMARLERGRFLICLLRRTPFWSYLLPGLILTILVGGSAGMATAARD